MKVPLDLSSLNKEESTNEGLALIRFALSLGTSCPHTEHWTFCDEPFFPFDLPDFFVSFPCLYYLLFHFLTYIFYKT